MFITSNAQLLPNDIGAAWYYDAMNMDGQGNVQSNGSAVSSWTDLSGNGRTVTQVTGANQPSYVVGGINGGNYVNFDGSSRYLSRANNNYAGEMTVMFLGSLDNAASARRFVSYGSSGGISVGTRITGLQKFDLTCNTVADQSSSADGFTVGQLVVLTAVLRTPSPGTWRVDFYKDGTAFETDIAASAPVASAASFVVGGFSTAASFWQGKIAMLAGWQRTLTTWELNQMHLLFKTRGGL